MRFKPLAVLALLITLNTFIVADVKLPSIISDQMVLQQQSNVNIWGWADPGEKIQVKGTWKSFSGSTTTADKDGKWKVSIPTPKASGPYEITIKANNIITLKNILIGEVWVCSGQSNMQWSMNRTENAEKHIAEADFPSIRLFTVKRVVADTPQADCTGNWSQCSPEIVAKFSAVGYYFGQHLHKDLNIPIGLISTNWGGTVAEAWTRKEYMQDNEILTPILQRYDDYVANFDTLLEGYPKQLKKWQQKAAKAKVEGKKVPRKPRNPVLRYQNDPSSLYNSMIAPIIPYGIKGVIWYQGEANARRAWQYRTLFPTMIENWRDDWNQGDFPFYFVQIAPNKGQNPEIREAQLISYRNTVNTGIVCTMDIGNPDNVHPTNKLDVGKRLSLWALAKDYGRKGIVYSGPLYKSYKIQDDKIRLSFDYIGSGLLVKDGPLTDFTIAGEDFKFVDAKAVIDGDTIVVSSDVIKKPKSVRFAWTNAAEPNLFNKEGLPASPFRTDDLPGETFDAR